MRQLSGSSIRVPGSFSFPFAKKRELRRVPRRIEREQPAEQKAKRNDPSFRADAAVTTE